ncbi:imelysin family protein [Cohaesibacter celericrescens]|uniref:imelysin family protein n=1 Tax=Cohaesibacter celericrescens TaxID=2067669 RepID=UPI003561E58B
MLKVCLVFLSVLIAPVAAQALDLRAIVDQHILSGYQQLADRSAELAKASESSCEARHDALTPAFHVAFDAWVAVSHLRFGPSEQQDRAFALAFWPDSRGVTPKTLSGLLRSQDPAIDDLALYQHVSIAARGFYALEFLLFDAAFVDKPSSKSCALIKVIAEDISANANAILEGWNQGYASLLADANNDTYRSRDEAVKQLYTSLTTGLQFTAMTRLGRPLGTFSKPRPKRAEARRSGRSLRHVILSLKANQRLAALLSDNDKAIDARFQHVIQQAEDLNDPVLQGVNDPMSRIRIEALQGAINTINDSLALDLAPKLGITAGFNSMDGD